ncbi:hypothetical protein D3C77_224190 [compost metagenome]
MSAPEPSLPPPPRSRARWFWRLLFVHAWLAAAFLFFSLIVSGVLLVMMGSDPDLATEQRVFAFLGGALILAGCLYLVFKTRPRQTP